MDLRGDMTRITIKAILPKKAELLNQRKLDRELRSALDRTGNIIRSEFRKTTKTWSDRNKPSFGKIGPKKFGNGRGIEVNTKSKIYFYLTHGTRDHPIAPRRAGALRFQTGYRAKTARRFIGSGSGGAFGPIAFSKGHVVSGIRARDFDKVIAEQQQKKFNRRIQAALFRAAS